jgi:hypothetical protein
MLAELLLIVCLPLVTRPMLCLRLLGMLLRLLPGLLLLVLATSCCCCSC